MKVVRCRTLRCCLGTWSWCVHTASRLSPPRGVPSAEGQRTAPENANLEAGPRTRPNANSSLTANTRNVRSPPPRQLLHRLHGPHRLIQRLPNNAPRQPAQQKQRRLGRTQDLRIYGRDQRPQEVPLSPCSSLPTKRVTQSQVRSSMRCAPFGASAGNLTLECSAPHRTDD